MPTLKNISPLGDLDVVLIGRTVPRGAEFDCTDDQAKWLLEQSDVYAPVDDAAKAIAADLAAASPTEEVDEKPKRVRKPKPPVAPTDTTPDDKNGDE